MGLTFKLSKDAIHGAGATAAAHADIEFVGVFLCHCVVWDSGIREFKIARNGPLVYVNRPLECA